MLVRILYLNVVSKLIFLTIVLLNNLTKKIKDFEIHYSGFCRIRMIKIDLSISVTGNFSGDMWSDNCYEQC